MLPIPSCEVAHRSRLASSAVGDWTHRVVLIGQGAPVDGVRQPALQSPDSSWGSCGSESGGVQGWVVGSGLLPADPDDPKPDTGDDTGGVWVALAAGVCVGI
jgi:hypothetical protein